MSDTEIKKILSFQEIGVYVIDGDRGVNYPSENELHDEGDCLFLSAKNVTKSGFRFNDVIFITEEKDNILGTGKLKLNDLVLTTRGTVGNVAFFDKSVPYSSIRINSGMVILRLENKAYCHRYLNQLLHSPDFNHQIINLSFGSAQPQLTVSIINKLSFNYPPLPHQRKIARILTTVDIIIEKTEAAIAKYKAIKQGMMHDLFTRGIDVKTGKLRPRFEDAAELYKETELGWIPKEWEVKRMDEIGCIISGGTPSSNIPDYWNGSIIWVTPADLSKLKFGYIADSERKITSFGLKNSSALLIPQRSIVLSSRAPIGYCAIVEKDFTTNQGCKSLALFEGNSAEFFYYNIVNHVSRIKLKGEGTTFAEISKKALEKIPFVWCKPKEQTEIAKRLISIDNHTQNEESFLAKYQKLKSGLMQDLLTGKKEVTPDPEDYKEMEN